MVTVLYLMKVLSKGMHIVFLDLLKLMEQNLSNLEIHGVMENGKEIGQMTQNCGLSV